MDHLEQEGANNGGMSILKHLEQKGANNKGIKNKRVLIVEI